MADDRAASAEAIAEISQKLAGEILTMPVLSDPEWDTYTLLADVDDASVGLTAFRYTEQGPPKSTQYPDVFDLFRELRNRTQGIDGAMWDIAIMKIHRDSARLVMNFVRGDAAEMWRITPENVDSLPELMRPRREDFPGV